MTDEEPEQEQVDKEEPNLGMVEPGVEIEQVDAASPTWDRSVKFLVAIISLILLVAVVAVFTDLILQIVAAGIIAYVLTPLISLIDERTPLSRGAAILLTYLVLALVLIGAIVNLGVSTFRQVVNLIDSIPDLLTNLVQWLSTTETLSIGPIDIDISSVWGSLDWNSIGDQLLAAVVPAVNQGGRTIVVILSSTFQVVTIILFTFIISIYLAFETGQMGGYISGLVYQPGYRRDTERMLREFGRIWQAYLRGQIVMSVIIFLAVWLSLSILGVQNSFGLGVISGLLEFLPVIGPLIGTVAAALVAFFQPSNYLGLEPWVYALIVIGVMVVIQQIENNLLVPRILGGALDLPPLVVIIGVFMGATLAGLIGAILAAPVLATAKLVGTYAWRKMFDLPPFPRPEQVSTSPPIPAYHRVRSLIRLVRQKLKKYLAGARKQY